MRSPLRNRSLGIEGFSTDSSCKWRAGSRAHVSNASTGATVRGLCCGSPTSRFSLRCGNPRASGNLILSPWSHKLHLFIFSSQESLWEGDLTLVLIFCRNFSSARQVLRGGCRLDFTSTSVLFIFASLQYYQLLLHMGDPYCASVK